MEETENASKRQSASGNSPGPTGLPTNAYISVLAESSSVNGRIVVVSKSLTPRIQPRAVAALDSKHARCFLDQVPIRSCTPTK